MSIQTHNPILDTLFHFDYPAYLKSKGWKAKRERALQLARGQCRVCGTSKRLDVHHRTYERIGFELDDDLTVLCRDCHSLYHADGRMPDYQAPKPVVKPSREERARWFANIAAKRKATSEANHAYIVNEQPEPEPTLLTRCYQAQLAGERK